VTRETALQLLIKVGFTAIFIGYLLVWLPQPVVGLSFIGAEIGEWVKFLPQVRSGEIVPGRNLFYLPPIALGLMMILWTAGWQNRRWQTWGLRGMAVLVALLAFPALEAIRFEPAGEWLLRLLLVILVFVVAILFPLTKRLPRDAVMCGSWLVIMLLGLLGLLLPTWAFLAMRPAISGLFRGEVGIGAGVWMNAAGHLAVLSASVLALYGQLRAKRPPVQAPVKIGSSG
jgi:hypothetical protein